MSTKTLGIFDEAARGAIELANVQFLGGVEDEDGLPSVTPDVESDLALRQPMGPPRLSRCGALSPGSECWITVLAEKARVTLGSMLSPRLLFLPTVTSDRPIFS